MTVEHLECRRLLAAHSFHDPHSFHVDVSEQSFDSPDVTGLNEDLDGIILQADNPRNGSIEGLKWGDRNGNGNQDANEVGLGGVIIYLDVNSNGNFDRGEPLTTTSFDDPATDFDEAGLYSFSVEPGEYVVREIVPEGYNQTVPGISGAEVLESETLLYEQGAAIGFHLGETRLTEDENGVSLVAMDVTVVWPDSCGVLHHEETIVDVFEDQIEIQMFGSQIGEICAQVISPESQTLEMRGLEAIDYNINAVLLEQSADEEPTPTLGIEGILAVGGNNQYQVEVADGEVVANINFGNQLRDGEGGQIRGMKWHDLNGNGSRDFGEPGLAGVTIYIDLNENRVHDENEPFAISMEDDPETRRDETGEYWITDVEPGIYVVTEIIPDDFIQTFPFNFFFEDEFPFPDLPPEFGPWHFIELNPGQVIEGLDFGNRSNEPGSIAGIVWEDVNGNARFDANESGQANVTVYVDINYSGAMERGEPSTVTLADDPDTEIDESGRYMIEGIAPGGYQVYEELPEGYLQTVPVNQFFGAFQPPNQPIYVEVSPGRTIDDINFANQIAVPGSLEGTKWIDVNGNSVREPDEPGFAGVTVFLDLDFDRRHDRREPSVVTMSDDPNTPEDETGRFKFEDVFPGYYEMREVSPDGYVQVFPPNFELDPPDDFNQPWTTGQHFVNLGSAEALTDLDFGNQETAPASIQGTKWLDANGNGARDQDEPGLADVLIYIDLNFNGIFDQNEPHAESQQDDPATEEDETGQYRIEGLVPGNYQVSEQVPNGYVQTFPEPIVFFDPFFDAPFFDDRFANPPHFVALSNGEIAEGIDFGNQEIEPGQIEGIKWNDQNGNGRFDENEAGIAGVTIYIDANFNGNLDANETFTVSQPDDPDTPANETGRYVFENVNPGGYAIGEVIPDNFEQTYPLEAGGGFDDPFFNPRVKKGQHYVSLGIADFITGIDFGNQEILPNAKIEGYNWIDLNGDAARSEDEPSLPGVRMYSDLNLNGIFDPGEPIAITQEDNLGTRETDESGRFELELPPGPHLILQVVPAGFEQTEPSPFRRVRFPYNLGKSIDVAPAELLTGVDFGNSPIDFEAAVEGVSWVERNNDLERNANEPGLAGMIVFADANLNGRLDENEIKTVTLPDDPQTRADESGTYRLELPLGEHLILQKSVRGHEQVSPVPGETPADLGYVVTLTQKGQVVQNADFASTSSTAPEAGSISGRVWIDSESRPGAEDILVFVDVNGSGEHEIGEPSRRTQRDDPNTPFDESGRYEFSALPPGTHSIRTQLPAGFVQTSPFGIVHIQDIGETTPLPDAEMIRFGISEIDVVRNLHGDVELQIRFEGVWPNGCGELLHDQAEATLNQDGIQINLFASSDQANGCNEAEQTLTQTIPLQVDDVVNAYWVGAVLHEQRADGTFAPAWVVEEGFVVSEGTTHSVRVQEGHRSNSVNFGIRSTELTPSDFNQDGRTDQFDIDLLAAAVQAGEVDARFDLNDDEKVDQEDSRHLIENVLETVFGDSNLDGTFDSADLVTVFQEGEYEDDVANNSGWRDGDWNGDGDFTSADLVLVFQEGNYTNAATRSNLAGAIDQIWSTESDQKEREV